MAYPVDETRVRDAEAQLGRTLPAALRARLLRDNGGEVECDGGAWQLFPVWDPTDRRTARKTANHVVAETRAAAAWRGFPPGAIAVAADGSGDLLVVPAGSDEIVIWRHETRELEPASYLVL